MSTTEYGCPDNDCDEIGCHRCYPRQNCPANHQKCAEFAENGEAYEDGEIAAVENAIAGAKAMRENGDFLDISDSILDGLSAIIQKMDASSTKEEKKK